jgi:gamma-glutamyltranspeptidase/glutathione hydrolase
VSSFTPRFYTRTLCCDALVLGAVATGHPRTSDAAVAMLREGGNAFDAIVAAGFAAAVAEPGFTSLGGGGFLLARTAEAEEVLFDFFVDTPGRGASGHDLDPHFLPVTIQFPGSEQVFNVGRGSVAVPGVLAGLLHVHRRLGRLPLRSVVAPAAVLARGGVVVTGLQAYVLGLLTPILGLEGGHLYTPSGRAPAEGERLRNPDLAAFLEALPDDGGSRFYFGGLAARIVADMHQGQGLLTADDLAAYRVLEREPLEVEYRDRRVLTNPAPSWGGGLVAFGLDELARSDLPRLEPDGPEHAVALAATLEAMERQHVEGAVRGFSRGTTLASVADAHGNVASMTTSNGEGSGYIVPGAGIMLNNMLGEDDLHPDGFHSSPPGQRVASMMSPSLVEDEAGPDLVLGSGGSKRIRTAVLQVAQRSVDFGTPLPQAVAAPRMHWDGEVLQVEPGLAEAALAALRHRWSVNLWPEPNLYFGGVHAVAPRRGQAAGDARRGGAAQIVA